MKIILEGDPKDIAALVVELQERQPEEFIPSDSSCEDSEASRRCSC